MMRIVIDLQGAQTESRFRGIGRYSLALSTAIARNAAEHEVWIVLNSKLAAVNDIRNHFDGILPSERIITFDVPANVSWETSDNTGRRRTAELMRECFLAELNPDFVLITSLFEGANYCDATSSIGRFLSSVPTAVVLYDLIPLLDPDNYLGSGWTRDWYMDKISSLRNANLLLSISNYSKKEAIDVLNLPQDRIAVISTAHNSDLFKPFTSADASKREVLEKFNISLPYVMYNGALESRKNLERLMHAFSLLPIDLQNNYQLVFVGKVSEAEKPKLLHLSYKYKINERFILTGHVTDDDLVTLFASCITFVFPSLHEGFGLPALEAMACGAPTIGSNVTSIPEVIGREDALFNPEDPKDIAQKIERVLTDIEFSNDLRNYAINRAATFSWDICAKNTLEAIQLCVHSTVIKPKESWHTINAQQDLHYRNLINAIAKISSEDVVFTQTELVTFANCIAKNRQYACSVARAHILPHMLTWRLEGPFDSSYSLALVNRELARALSELGHCVALHSTEGPGDFEPSHAFLERNTDILQMHNMVEKIPQAVADVTSRFIYPPRVVDMQCRLNILHHYGWEESGFPLSWIDDFNSSLQGVACMSEHVKKILVDHGLTAPIAVSGLGVDHWERVVADPDYRVTGKLFKFLHVSSCFPRKGIQELLEAYGRAFQVSDDVTLIIKTFPNPHNEIHKWISVERQRNKYFPDVQVIEQDLSDEELKSLYQHCQALVAPSKAEGFGLPMAEAMLSGLPVITSSWGGQLDFCTPSTAWLVDYQFERADTHFGIFSSVWAKPNVNELAMTMRELYETSHAIKSERIQKARNLLLSKYKWTDSAERLVQATRLWSNRTIPNEPRVGWISSWNTRCGIAAYSQNLVSNLSFSPFVFANHASSLLAPDEDFVVRCWNTDGEDNLLQLEEQLKLHSIEVVVIQFNNMFFDFEHLSLLINRLLDAELKVLITLHATHDPVQLPHKAMSNLSSVLARCHRVLVHSPDDMNRLKNLKVIENVCLFPHGVLDYEPSGNYKIKHYPEAEEFIVASYGYFLPHKGLLELIDAVVILHHSGLPIKLQMVNAEYSHAASSKIIAQAKHKIAQFGAGDYIEMRTEYLSDEQCLDALNLADLVVYPYQQTGESSSAAVRHGIASRRPVAVTPLAIFDDVSPAVLRLPGISPEQIAVGIAEIIKLQKSNSSELSQREIRMETWREEHRFSRVARRLSGMITAIFEAGL